MNIPPRPFKLSVIACAICYANLTYAQDAQVQALQTIQVKASNAEQSSEQTKAYNVKTQVVQPSLILRLRKHPKPLMSLLVSKLKILLTSTRDVLSNTPGVTVTGLETNRTTYTARGFDISNILVDGIGIPQVDSYNYNNSDADSYFYDRIEIVKGADALTNALGDPGATINYIRKRPTKEFQANAGVSYGSWDTQRYEADISGSLTQDGRVRGRLVGYEKVGDSYLDRYSEEKTVFKEF